MWQLVAVVAVAAPAADPLPAWDAKFAGPDGWIGGDGVYSATVGPRRVVWLFGDTLVGTAKAGKRSGAAVVNNTLGVQDGHGPDAPTRFVIGKKPDGKPVAVFVPPDGRGWFWPQAAAVDGGALLVFLAQIDKGTDPGVFGFKQVGEWVAVVANPHAEPEGWTPTFHKLPMAEYGPERTRSWGSALLADGGFLYAYGFEEAGTGIGRKRITVARVPAGKATDFAAWRYRTAAGTWSETATDAAPLAGGLASEFSVTPKPGGGGFVLAYTENGLGDRIVMRTAPDPAGPWGEPTLVYKCPEMGADKGVFSYAAKAHPWAAAGNELVVSYCVNTWDFGRLFKDDAVYRPKFVRVRLGNETRPAPESLPARRRRSGTGSAE